MADVAAAAFPDDAVQIVFTPNSLAFTQTSAEDRSFSDAVGFLPSSFTHTLHEKPDFSHDTGVKGVPPTISVGTSASGLIGKNGMYRNIPCRIVRKEAGIESAIAFKSYFVDRRPCSPSVFA
jgi:hypothetical protein